MPSVELGPPVARAGPDRRELVDLGRRGGRILSVDGDAVTVREPVA